MTFSWEKIFSLVIPQYNLYLSFPYKKDHKEHHKKKLAPEISKEKEWDR
jgi:hypothetical protein